MRAFDSTVVVAAPRNLFHYSCKQFTAAFAYVHVCLLWISEHAAREAVRTCPLLCFFVSIVSWLHSSFVLLPAKEHVERTGS